MDLNLRTSTKQFKTEIGIGKTLILLTAKHELNKTLDMLDLTAWMPWLWLCIRCGFQRISSRLQ